MAQSTERFDDLVLPHLDDAYTLARYLLRDEHDAQDAVQDAALRAFRHFGGYAGGEPRAWFLAIVRNCCFNWQRRHRIQRLSVPFNEDTVVAASEARSADSGVIASSERAAIERALAELSVEYREVIVLRELEEMSYAQIATVIGAPVGTVMSRLSRARRRLAAALGNTAQEAG
jgi:RNA polymerase sigma-70 factor (ECF subfamily)